MEARHVATGSMRFSEGVARGPRSTLLRRAWLVLAMAAVATLALAARAEAYVYWAESESLKLLNPGGIFRADLDGTSSPFEIEGFLNTYGVAVDNASVYWSTPPGNIGRASLDGTGGDRSFITDLNPPPGSPIYGVAVDGAHIYWTSAATGAIGRANLDGTGVDQGFIVGASDPRGVAVDGAHVYWANFDTDTIGRANLDGTGVDQGFIVGASDPGGVAVDGAHVYWGGTAIGRANLDGTGVDPFIDLNVLGVAVDGAHVYWANTDGGIGRANLDGTGVDQCFIRGARANGVAVDALGPPASSDPGPPPSYDIRISKTKLNKKRGSAKLTVRLPVGFGGLKLAKTKSLKGQSKRALESLTLKLSVKPRGTAKKRLNTKGKAKVKAKITYTPDECGPSDTVSKKIKLVKR